MNVTSYLARTSFSVQHGMLWAEEDLDLVLDITVTARVSKRFDSENAPKTPSNVPRGSEDVPKMWPNVPEIQET